MRIAVIADIHGNLPALEATLDRIEKLKVDRIVVAGDIVVGSPDSRACWERVKALGCPVLRGNHERYVFDFGTERAGADWRTPQFGPVRYAVAQFGAAERQELAVLPGSLRFADVPDVLFVHGSARSDNDQILPHTPAAELEPMFAGTTERWLVRAHNHYAGARQWGDRHIVTVGSVGLPLDGVTAGQFTVLEQRQQGWAVQHVCVPYDVQATLRRFRESGYLEAAGPMAELYLREVATAAFHIVPFLRFQSALRRRGQLLSLEDAMARFFRDGPER